MRFALMPSGAAVLALACGDGTAPIVPAQVSIAPLADTLEVGWTGTLTASAVDDAGLALTSATFDWQTSNAAVLNVEGNAGSGTVLALQVGTAIVTVSSAGVTGSATVTVVAARPAASGQWVGSGSEGSRTVLLDLTMGEAASGGRLTGTGTIEPPGLPPYALSLTGDRVGSRIEFTMTVPAYQPFWFDGVYTDSSMVGRINGSGFLNFPMTLTRTTPLGAGGSAPH